MTTPTPETPRCPKCRLLMRDHPGYLAFGRAQACPSPPAQTTKTARDCLDRMAYGPDDARAAKLREHDQKLARECATRAAAVPVSEPDGHTPFDRVDQHASAESDPAFRALVEALVRAQDDLAALRLDGRDVGPDTKRVVTARAAVLAAHAKVVADLSRAREALRDARAALDRDRTGLAAALAVILDEVKGRRWMRADGDGDEGGTWGSYGYREQTVATLRREVGWAFDAISRHATAALRASGDLATAECRKADDILRALASGGET